MRNKRCLSWPFPPGQAPERVKTCPRGSEIEALRATKGLSGLRIAPEEALGKVEGHVGQVATSPQLRRLVRSTQRA